MGKIVLSSVTDILDKIGESSYEDNYGLYNVYYKISKMFREYRKSKGLSQKDLATLLGVGQSMVSKLESGEYNPTIEQLWKISHKLDWELDVSFNIKDTNYFPIRVETTISPPVL